MGRMKHLSVLLALCLVGSPASAESASDAEVEARIDAFIQAAMDCTPDIPGLNLAVVRGGQPIIAKGYGYKTLERDDPVTNKTLFNVASVTKAMAATITGMVLDDHELDWRTPIRDILGADFHLSDPYRTEQLNFNDMFSHRAGLLGHNMIRIYGFTEQEMLQRMEHLNYTMLFRDEYHYNNLMYGLATYAARVLQHGVPWEQQFTDRVLRPLGMTDTTFVQLSADRFDEYARGHFYHESGNLKEVDLEVPRHFYRSFSSMGGVASTAGDMGRWLAAQVNGGRAQDGTQVIPQHVLEASHRPVSVSGGAWIQQPEFPVVWDQGKYARGWGEGVYRGYHLSGHDGSMAGVLSLCTFLPAVKHGVYISTNIASDRDVRAYLTMFIYDLLEGYDPWVNEDNICQILPNRKNSHKKSRSIIDDLYAVPKLLQREIKDNMKLAGVTVLGKTVQTSKMLKGTLKTLRKTRKQLNEYAGTYGNYAYGSLTVYVSEDRLYMRYGTTATWDLGDSSVGDVFSAEGTGIFWYDRQTAIFHRDEDNEISAVTVTFEPSDPPTFQRDLDWNNPPPPPDKCPGQ